MIRLFLNGDSHFEEAVQSFNDMNFFSILPPEKSRNMRDMSFAFYMH